MAHVFTRDASRLESPERKKLLPAQDILARLGIRRGSTLIDFGCGTGYFTVPALDIVGRSGKVIAVDVSEEMLSLLRARAGDRPNLEIIRSGSIRGLRGDLILLFNVLHEMDNPKEFLGDCLESAAPDGSVAVIDWQKKPTGMGPPLRHRLSKEEVTGIVGSDYKEHDISSQLYFLEFFPKKAP